MLFHAQEILESGRPEARKLVFLVTDGFSNGNDPRRAASLLKGLGATIFTFGVQTGNVDELRDIATGPSHCYFSSSFTEFETLARKALHKGNPSFIIIIIVVVIGDGSGDPSAIAQKHQ